MQQQLWQGRGVQLVAVEHGGGALRLCRGRDGVSRESWGFPAAQYLSDVAVGGGDWGGR